MSKNNDEIMVCKICQNQLDKIKKQEKEDVEERLKERILGLYSGVLNYQKENPNYGLITASYSLSIRKILDAEKLRGNL